MSPKRKKAEKKTSTKSQTKDQSFSDKIQNLNITKSYTSLAYGVVTVVVLFILVVVGIRTFSNQEDVDITEDGAVTEVENNTYIVLGGQTLWDISEEVYGTGFEWERIAEANNLDNPGQIEEGMKLVIPRLRDNLAQATPSATGGATQQDATPTPSQAAQAQASATQQPTATKQPTQTPKPTSAPTSTPKPTKAPTSTPQPTKAPNQESQTTQGAKIEGGSYKIAQGDTLWDIAVRAYGDGYRWVDIYHANMENISNPDLIYVGQSLTIPRSN